MTFLRHSKRRNMKNEQQQQQKRSQNKNDTQITHVDTLFKSITIKWEHASGLKHISFNNNNKKTTKLEWKRFKIYIRIDIYGWCSSVSFLLFLSFFLPLIYVQMFIIVDDSFLMTPKKRFKSENRWYGSAHTKRKKKEKRSDIPFREAYMSWWRRTSGKKEKKCFLFDFFFVFFLFKFIV